MINCIFLLLQQIYNTIINTTKIQITKLNICIYIRVCKIIGYSINLNLVFTVFVGVFDLVYLK